MKNPIKTYYGVVILTACLILAIVFINKNSKQLDIVTNLIQPSTQLAQVSPTATLTLSPSTNSASVGSTFNVDIVLNTGGATAYGVDVNRIHFTPGSLQVVDADPGTAGVQIAPGSLMSMNIINTVDNVSGTIQFSQLASYGSTYSGTGVIASITFQVISTGSSNVTLDFTGVGSGTDSNVAGLQGDLLASVGSGSYTGLAVDSTAPTISSISPSGISQTGATVSWTTNENSNTQVQYGLTTSYGSQTTLNSSLVTSHSAVISGLTSNTTYHYRVLSRDAANNLATSADNTFTTQSSVDTTAPSAPGTPTLTVMSATQINLSWTASTDAVGVTGYRVERCSGSATCTGYTQIATPSTNSYSDTGLTASTIYRYRISAVDAAINVSSYSSPANTTTQAPPDTTAPTISGITLSGITTSGATVSWTTNENSDTQVQYGLTTSYGLQTTLNSSLLTSHSAALSSLSPGTAYHYRVLSRDAANNLAMSTDNVLTTQTLADTTIPTTPTGFTVSPTSESQIQLSWTASTDPTGVGQSVSGVAGYQVFRSGTLLNSSSLITSTAYLNTGLTPGVSYSYQVAAVDNAGNVSTRTASISTTTPLLSLAVQRNIILVLEGASITKRNVSGTVEYINPSTGATISQSNITTNASGQFVLDVPAGLLPVVSMRPVVLGYLPRIITGVDLRNATVLNVNFPTLPAGDLNGDRLINSLDFSYLNSKWGTSDSLADINRDNTVNSLDFPYMSNNWLLAGE